VLLLARSVGERPGKTGELSFYSLRFLAIKPVTFRYKNDEEGTPQFGLIAEEVANINPNLVLRDDEGKVYTVRYDAVNAMLLNEFLKEHRKVHEQPAAITALNLVLAQERAANAEQQKQIDALATGLQKVSREIELTKPAPRLAENER
jgi:uncharacterized coiled-coil protein SlyX